MIVAVSFEQGLSATGTKLFKFGLVVLMRPGLSSRVKNLDKLV